MDINSNKSSPNIFNDQEDTTLIVPHWNYLKNVFDASQNEQHTLSVK